MVRCEAKSAAGTTNSALGSGPHFLHALDQFRVVCGGRVGGGCGLLGFGVASRKRESDEQTRGDGNSMDAVS
jgi:hypothetical protein